MSDVNVDVNVDVDRVEREARENIAVCEAEIPDAVAAEITRHDRTTLALCARVRELEQENARLRARSLLQEMTGCEVVTQWTADNRIAANCGDPVAWRYKAMGGGYMHMCGEHGAKHAAISEHFVDGRWLTPDERKALP